MMSIKPKKIKTLLAFLKTNATINKIIAITKNKIHILDLLKNNLGIVI